MRKTNVMSAGAVVLAAALAAGCSHQGVKKAGAAGSGPREGAQVPGTPGGIDASEAVVRNDEMHAIDDLKMVHFDYDSDVLAPEARAVLRKNAAWLKKNPMSKVQVAGHCDQRGTEEYNLALGQRRAKAVREYLRMLGVGGRRVATISYGKEKPICQDMREECWLRNRRAETFVAFPLSVGRTSTK